VGVIGLVTGAVFGVIAKSKMDAANAGHCSPDDHCDATGLADRSDALSAANVSTVGIVGGLACMAGGAALYLTAPEEGRPRVGLAPRVTPGGGGITLRAIW
jgi:hypothetical protein